MTDIRANHITRHQHGLGAASLVIPIDPLSPYLKVGFGQRTFDAEGVEALGQYFSRSITWPGGASSGVTIGRGYDMGFRSRAQIVRELTLSGVSQQDSNYLSQGAGLRGAAAAQFIRSNLGNAPILTLEAQQRLFDAVTTPEAINDIKRIFAKADTVAAYGPVDWDTLPTAAQELVFDLRYRGDYTPTTRRRIQPILANQEWSKLPELMNDTAYWSGLGVPHERIAARASIVEGL
jgi:hypothetical protein